MFGGDLPPAGSGTPDELKGGPDELILHNVRLNESNFSNRRFSYISVAGSRLVAVDFSRARMSQGGLGGGFDPSDYYDCVFEGATLKNLVPGRAPFLRCSFRNVLMTNIQFHDAQFVDCTFSGRLRRVTFSATPSSTEKLGRTVNEYSGNDFSEATLHDVAFRGGIDLDKQRLPTGSGYIVVRNAPAILPRVHARIQTWRDDEERDHAETILWVLGNDCRTGQIDVFTTRSFLGKTPEAADKLATLLTDGI